MSNIVEAMQWRYATKQFDPEKKLSEEQLRILKEALRLAPSSFGLQPWHFVVVEDESVRQQLLTAGYGQAQIVDASHFFVLATEINVDEKLVDRYMRSIAVTRNMPLEMLEEFRGMLNGSIQMKGEVGAREWAARQVYIALGTMIAVAASAGIDTAPMEGFDPAQFDAILGLDKRGLTARVMVAVGFRKSDDPASQMVKVRYDETEVFTTI
ncbi:MAG: NAD(P)H-dependent oxidoreductase [Minisyncoccota bacterium]